MRATAQDSVTSHLGQKEIKSWFLSSKKNLGILLQIHTLNFQLWPQEKWYTFHQTTKGLGYLSWRSVDAYSFGQVAKNKSHSTYWKKFFPFSSCLYFCWFHFSCFEGVYLIQGIRCLQIIGRSKGQDLGWVPSDESWDDRIMSGSGVFIKLRLWLLAIAAHGLSCNPEIRKLPPQLLASEPHRSCWIHHCKNRCHSPCLLRDTETLIIQKIPCLITSLAISQQKSSFCFTSTSQISCKYIWLAILTSCPEP